MSTRTERVGDQIRTELSTLLGRAVRDPGAVGITVTHVHMTKDLKQARVYFTIPSGARARREAARALRRSRAFLRWQLGQRLHLRHVPELSFIYDDTVEQQDRIAHLFDEIKTERSDRSNTDRDVTLDSHDYESSDS